MRKDWCYAREREREKTSFDFAYRKDVAQVKGGNCVYLCVVLKIIDLKIESLA